MYQKSNEYTVPCDVICVTVLRDTVATSDRCMPTQHDIRTNNSTIEQDTQVHTPLHSESTTLCNDISYYENTQTGAIIIVMTFCHNFAIFAICSNH